MGFKRKTIWKGLLLVLLGVGMLVGLIASDWFWNAMNPVFHRDVLYQCAGEYKMDPLLIASVISAESSFNPIATSKKKAMGLMQLMPETAFELAQELKLDVVNEEDLYQPDVNIRLGFYYLVKLSREFNGNIVFALAAYNAGLSRAKVWAGSYRGESEDEVIRRIPLVETRGFVKAVLKSYRRYKWIQSLRQVVRGN